MCRVKWEFCAKLLPHVLHTKGFSPVCNSSCLFNWPGWVNLLSHFEHLYGFSPVWIISCLSNVCLKVNVFWHTLHSNGLSPECKNSCFFNSLSVMNILSHCVHKKLFSPSPCLTFSWIFKYCLVVNLLSHNVQLNDLPLVWDNSCCLKLARLVKLLPQVGQTFTVW